MVHASPETPQRLPLRRFQAARLFAGIGLFLLLVDLPQLHSQDLPADFRIPGLVRDRRQAEALVAVRRLEAEGNPVDFCTAVQWVLDQPRDSLAVSREGTVRSIRGIVEQILHDSAQHRLEDYRRIVGPNALVEWQRAKLTSEDDDDCAIVRRYFFTEAGGSAAVALVNRWLDQGSHDLAASLALRVLNEPAHQVHHTPALVQRLLTSLSRAGRYEEMLALRHLHPEWAVPSLPSESSTMTATVAVMLTPEWTAPLGDLQKSTVASTYLQQWVSQQRELESPAALAARPVVAGLELLYRDLDTLRSIDLRNGQVAWEYTIEPGYDSAIPVSNLEEPEIRARRYQFGELIAANSAVNNVATDGRRVYLLDDTAGALEALSKPTEIRDRTPAERRDATRNQLIALRLGADLEGLPRLVWSTADGAGATGGLLDGHVFLGPPLVTPGWLYAITESDRELSLAALHPRTGTVRWVQPIAEADRSFFEDRARGLRDCVPTLAGGLVLCPTHLGLLVAVDAVTGRLVWVHVQQNPVPDVRTPVFRTGSTNSAQLRPAAFTPQAQISEGRLYYLAGQATGLYRIDLLTGQTVWRVDARTADAVVHVSPDAIYVVYRDSVRAHAADDGRELWQVRLPSPVTGKGVAFGDNLYIPLTQSGLMRLRLSDGQFVQSPAVSSEALTGHLVATSEGIAALGSEGIACYRWTQKVRADLERSLVQSGSLRTEELLQMAELLLAEGDLAGAAERLETVRRSPRKTLQDRSEGLLRSTYQQLLRQEAEHSEIWLSRWEPLCRLPQHRTQWLIERGERCLENRQPAELQSVMLALLKLPVMSELVATAGDHGLAVSSIGWMRRALHQGGLADDKDFLAAVASVIEADQSGNASRIVESCLFSSPLAEELRFSMAQAAIDRGQWHAAETWLMRNTESKLPTVAGHATRRLAELYVMGERPAAAAELWAELQDRYARVDVGDGITGRDYVDRQASSTLTAAAFRRRSPWTKSLGALAVRENRQTTGEGPRVDYAAAEGEPEFYSDRMNRLRLSPREDADFEWTMRTNAGDSWLLAWDRTVQQPRLKLRFPNGSFSMPQTGMSHWPHALPLGTSATMRMASLLQGNQDGQAWDVTIPEWAGRSGIPLCGPISPRVALYQLRSTLVAVDPAEGRVLWRRNDLEPNSGLLVNDRAGGLLLSDTLVGVIDPDRAGFRLFDVNTGAKLKSVRLELEQKNLKRYVVGARVAFWVNGTEGKQIAIWDAATDQRIHEDSLLATQFFDLMPDRQSLYWVNDERELCVYDMAQGQLLVRCKLESSDTDSAASLRVMKQAGRYFVNFGRPLQLVRTEHYHQHPNGHTLPVQMVRDGLLGIDETGRQVAWRTVIPQSAVILWGQLPVPALILLGQIRDKHDTNRLWNRIDVLDLNTGERLGGRDQIHRDEWRTAEYDGEHGRITLRGPRNAIEIELAPRLPHQFEDGEPL